MHMIASGMVVCKRRALEGGTALESTGAKRPAARQHTETASRVDRTAIPEGRTMSRASCSATWPKRVSRLALIFSSLGAPSGLAFSACVRGQCKPR